uniref:Caspase a n=1 Tax=Poecilia reticulata TaxID=8081 RepID=A0A3P9N2Z7_POERE
MAPKKPTQILEDVLENLSERNFKKFCSGLVGRDKRVKKNQVEKKDFLEVAEVMIDKYADEALKVAEELLRDMDCEQAANDLGKYRNIIWIHFRFSCFLSLHVCQVYSVTENNYRNRVALLITNIKFSDEKLSRHGAEKDEENMEKLLQSLGYEVVKYQNLTGKRIDEALKDFAKHPKLKQTDSVFVVIMSHGKLGKILGVDCKEGNPDEFAVDKIYKYLNSNGCQALINKPKVVILLHCSSGQETCSHVHDFLMSVRLPADNKAYRETANGSILIQNIVKVFTPESYQKHIIDLFTKVQDFVSKCGDDKQKQMPVIDRMTLNKKFYLYPGLLDN